MFKKREKGFTLIELMVVIAIIAILATVVLVALQGARDAAEDSNRKAAVAQARSLAEVEYAVSQNYDKLGGITAGDGTEIGDLLTAYGGTEDGAMVVFGSGEEYCISVNLKSEEFFCASDGQSPTDAGSACTAAGDDCS